jgi:hypothetical protein
MSTIYTWGELATMTASTLASDDRIFVYDTSASTPKYATIGDIAASVQSHVSTSSNGATISGANSGLVTMGTSTAIVLAAPTRPGLYKTFVATTTSTVAKTITASASSLGLGTSIFTFPDGADTSVRFESISTSMWVLTSVVLADSTALS